MNITLLHSLPALVADIIVPPPPTTTIVPDHLGGNGLASLGFWVLAMVAAAMLWWLRQRQPATNQPASVAAPE